MLTLLTRALFYAGKIDRRSINSCLCTVGSVDGCVITTSEGIGSSKKGFSHIQGTLSRFAYAASNEQPSSQNIEQNTPCQAMPLLDTCANNVFADRYAEYSASQCGFCTPGFIVATHQALTKCQEKGEKPTEDILQKGLDGNLCRCTGYRPILDACKV